MSGFELAQLNVARPRAPRDDPRLAEFFDNVDRINALAEAAEGFVWRHDADDGARTARLFGAAIVTISVWRDLASLHAFVHATAHADFLRRRREWFERAAGPSMVLWWVPQGHRPALAEARDRLRAIGARGPAPDAFDFRSPFPAPAS